MGWLWQDVHLGLRAVVKDRGFFFTSVVALGLGIGSTTAIFSVIDNVLLEPFPYTDGQRLMAIDIHDKGSSDEFGREMFSIPEFLDYQAQNHVFDRSIGVYQDTVLLTGTGPSLSFKAARVTGNTFDFLGVPPLLGRPATPDDAKPGAPPVFVLRYKVWRKSFGLDRSILGKTFILNDKPTTLVGIMPQRFAWWGADLWIPTYVDRADDSLNAPFFFLLGHLKPGVNSQNAAADLQILAERFSKIYPKNYPKQFDVQVRSLVDNVVGKFRRTLYTLLAAVGLLLLIACANVANLLLAKATAREKEFAIRLTLGARRWHLVRQLMTESVLLALAGAVVGCAFAFIGLKGLVSLIPQFTFPDEAVIHLNTPVLLATLACAILTALIFGLAPALGASNRDLNEPLKTSGRGNSGFRRGRLRNALIVSEVALSVVLLAGAGLLMRSFLLERQVDLGFSPARLLSTFIQLPTKQYKTGEQQTRFMRQLLARLQGLPGVESASVLLGFPPFGGIGTDFEVAGKTHNEKWKGVMMLCDPRFFETLHVRLLRGRLITDQDVAGARKVATINQTFASKYFPGEDPIGRRVKLVVFERAPVPVPDPWFEIVGVTSDIKNQGVREAILPEADAPYSLASFGQFGIMMRTAGNPSAMVNAMNNEIWAMDKSIVPQNTNTVEESLELFEFSKPRFGLTLFAVFAAIGLILVSLGVYSVISYTMTQRSHEIGIRMALGASAGNVRGLVIRTGLQFVLIGIGAGLVLAIVATRLLASEFYGVSPYDPLTLSSVIAVLMAVGLAACYVPSRRATRVDPVISLRYE
jgi:putative ABC transport system permease protein